MIALPTASKLQDAALCPTSVTLPVIPSAHPAGDTGHDRHELLIHALEAVRGGLAPDVITDNPVEQHWLDTVFSHPFTPTLTGYAPEVAYGYDVETGQAWCWGRIPARQYPPHAPTTICGTADYVLADEEIVTIIDVKTGRREVPGPKRNLQLKSLAVAAAKFHGVFRAKVAILHATADGDAVWVEHGPVWDLGDLMEMAEELRQLHLELNAPKPRLATGPHCNVCNAFAACPAQRAIVSRWSSNPDAPDDVIALITPETAAHAYRRLQGVKAAVKKAEGALYAYAAHNTLHLGGDDFFGSHTTTKEIFTRESFPLLAAEIGAEKALEAFDLETSKTAIGKAVRAATPRGKKDERAKEVLAKLRAAGAVREKTSTSVGEFKRAQALPAPGVAPPPTAPAEPVLSAAPPYAEHMQETGEDLADVDELVQQHESNTVGAR